MASLVPGYDYDIFIRYCQKENKGDHWSEFANALRTEHEATFKEDVSVHSYTFYDPKSIPLNTSTNQL